MALTDPAVPNRAAVPAAPDVRAVDPQALAAATTLARLLDGETVDGGSTISARVDIRPGVGCWLLSTDARLAVRALDGEAAALHPDRVESIVRALDRLGDVLDVVETASGLVLEFTHCREEAFDAPGVVVRVEAPDGGTFALFHLVPRSDWRAPPSRVALGSIGSALLPVSRTVRGPRLAIDAASGIETGDVLMLAAGPWPMTATAPTGAWTGMFDPDSGRLAPGPLQVSTPRSKDGAMNSIDGSEGQPAGDAIGGFAVPIAIGLPPASATVDELAALTAGSTLVLGPVAAGLEIELRIADRVLATGELVRLGDQYAVLVTDVPHASGTTTLPTA